MPAVAKNPGKPDVGVAAIDPQARAILDLARDTPHRKPDGTAFLPIATQRIFAMRWLVSHEAAVPIAYEIPGHVITNPGTGTSVPDALAVTACSPNRKTAVCASSNRKTR